MSSHILSWTEPRRMGWLTWTSRMLIRSTISSQFSSSLEHACLSLASRSRVTFQPTSGPNNYYYYGFPLPWLIHVIVDLPFSHTLWIPAPMVIDDILLWAATGYLGLCLGNRIRRPCIDASLSIRQDNISGCRRSWSRDRSSHTWRVWRRVSSNPTRTPGYWRMRSFARKLWCLSVVRL